MVLALTIVAKYGKHLAGSWRWIYVVTAVMALYLNVFVLIVQAFLKVESLAVLAPNQNEPPFLIAQGAALVVFVIVGIISVLRFR